MKKILKSLFFVSLFALSGLFTSNVFADDCNITKFEFSKNKIKNESKVNLLINATEGKVDGCKNKNYYVEFYEEDATTDNVFTIETFSENSINFNNSLSAEIPFLSGNNNCLGLEGGYCDYYAKILNYNKSIEIKTTPTIEVEKNNSDVKWKIDGDVFGIISSCAIKSITTSPSGEQKNTTDGKSFVYISEDNEYKTVDGGPASDANGNQHFLIKLVNTSNNTTINIHTSKIINDKQLIIDSTYEKYPIITVN